jgi:Zn-dependent protease with chaperone function
VAALLLAVTVAAPAAARDQEGVRVGHMAIVRNLYSAEALEKQAGLQYDALTRKARMSRALLADDHPQVVRLRAIARDLLPHATKFNARAERWTWEINVINSPDTINAFCMPGGRIVFFTGILDKLKLTDDEVALIMGHEIAHALREHARERAAKQMITNIGVIALSVLTGSSTAGQLASVGGDLLGRRFSRSDETEADLIGMELAARAGYDPRSGVSLWTKMGGVSRGAPPQWLSTHPSSDSRIKTIKDNLKDVMPLYERARRSRG